MSGNEPKGISLCTSGTSHGRSQLLLKYLYIEQSIQITEIIIINSFPLYTQQMTSLSSKMKEELGTDTIICPPKAKGGARRQKDPKGNGDLSIPVLLFHSGKVITFEFQMIDFVDDTLGLITDKAFSLPDPENVCMGNSGLYPRHGEHAECTRRYGEGMQPRSSWIYELEADNYTFYLHHQSSIISCSQSG